MSTLSLSFLVHPSSKVNGTVAGASGDRSSVGLIRLKPNTLYGLDVSREP